MDSDGCHTKMGLITILPKETWWSSPLTSLTLYTKGSTVIPKGALGCSYQKSMMVVIPKGPDGCHSKRAWGLSFQKDLKSYQKDLIDVIPKGPDGYHTKRGLMAVIPKGAWWLSYQKEPEDCHTKRGLMAVIPKGSNGCHAKGGFGVVIPKGACTSMTNVAWWWW